MNNWKFSDIKVGQSASFIRKITIEAENKFREISGDVNPLHYDDNYAKEISDGKYQKHVSFGMLTACLYSTAAGVYIPGKYSLIHSFDEISFLYPVFAGDTLTVDMKVIDKSEALNLINLKITVKNQDNKLVSKAKMKIIVLK